MSKRKRNDTIYYSDDINVDFQTTKGAKRIKLDENYEFIRKKPLERFFSFILYYFIAHPILALFCVFKGTTFKNKKNLKDGDGCKWSTNSSGSVTAQDDEATENTPIAPEVNTDN